MKHLLETDRLILREMTQDDYAALAEVIQDNETMYAYEGARRTMRNFPILGKFQRCMGQHGEHGDGSFALTHVKQMNGPCLKGDTDNA